MTPIHHSRISHPFQGGGPPADPRGGGLPVYDMHQGEGEPRGGGIVMSHPFQEEVGGRDELPFSKRDGGP